MPDLVLLAVLLAALLHALWNALVKGGADKALNLLAVVLGAVPLAAVVLCAVPMPGAASRPWIGVGIVLHVGYQLFLLRAYRFGDLTQVYPIARGSAPLIVALVSVLFLGVALEGAELLGVGLIVAGIASVSLVRRGDGRLDLPSAAFALGTGAFIAAYSLVDGTGARLSGSPVGYYAWEAIGNALVLLVAARLRRPGLVGRTLREGRLVMAIGGGAAVLRFAG